MLLPIVTAASLAYFLSTGQLHVSSGLASSLLCVAAAVIADRCTGSRLRHAWNRLVQPEAVGAAAAPPDFVMCDGHFELDVGQEHTELAADLQRWAGCLRFEAWPGACRGRHAKTPWVHVIDGGADDSEPGRWEAVEGGAVRVTLGDRRPLILRAAADAGAPVEPPTKLLVGLEDEPARLARYTFVNEFHDH